VGAWPDRDCGSTVATVGYAAVAADRGRGLDDRGGVVVGLPAVVGVVGVGVAAAGCGVATVGGRVGARAYRDCGSAVAAVRYAAVAADRGRGLDGRSGVVGLPAVVVVAGAGVAAVGRGVASVGGCVGAWPDCDCGSTVATVCHAAVAAHRGRGLHDRGGVVGLSARAGVAGAGVTAVGCGVAAVGVRVGAWPDCDCRPAVAASRHAAVAADSSRGLDDRGGALLGALAGGCNEPARRRAAGAGALRARARRQHQRGRGDAHQQ
jgi:hypothetical protein